MFSAGYIKHHLTLATLLTSQRTENELEFITVCYLLNNNLLFIIVWRCMMRCLCCYLQATATARSSVAAVTMTTIEQRVQVGDVNQTMTMTSKSKQPSLENRQRLTFLTFFIFYLFYNTGLSLRCYPVYFASASVSVVWMLHFAMCRLL